MTLQDRIQVAISQPGKKLSKAGLARACGIKPPSVSDWFTGKSKSIDGKHLMDASRYLGVNPDWLQHGTGPMTGPDHQPDPLADAPERMKAALMTVMGMLTKVPDDQWGNALMAFAELLQKDQRFR